MILSMSARTYPFHGSIVDYRSLCDHQPCWDEHIDFLIDLDLTIEIDTDDMATGALI